MGTPGFMAPEQATSGMVTPRTDVYGLGATLFFALTGRAPFEGNAHEAVARVQDTDPPRVRSLRPEVPVELEAIVHNCLEKNPAANEPELRAHMEPNLCRCGSHVRILAAIRRAASEMRAATLTNSAKEPTR